MSLLLQGFGLSRRSWARPDQIRPRLDAKTNKSCGGRLTRSPLLQGASVIRAIQANRVEHKMAILCETIPQGFSVHEITG